MTCYHFTFVNVKKQRPQNVAVSFSIFFNFFLFPQKVDFSATGIDTLSPNQIPRVTTLCPFPPVRFAGRVIKSASC